jgi:hypothetical protein
VKYCAKAQSKWFILTTFQTDQLADEQVTEKDNPGDNEGYAAFGY